MKADQSGTSSEQRLFRMGFKTASERPQCGNCKNVNEIIKNPDSFYESLRFECKKARCAIRHNAICNEWEAR